MKLMISIWHRIFRKLMMVLGFVSFISCEKEIDIQLDGVAKKYVIEGVVTDQEGGCQVLISQTKDFHEDNTRLTVSDAVVAISDGSDTFDLEETAPGTYTSNELVGIPGGTYYLSVKIDSEEYTARSTMPEVVRMDSLYISEEFLFDETEKLATVDFLDPAGVPNYYRFVLYVNDEKKRQIFAFNDDLTDGNPNAVRLYYLTEDEEDEDKIRSGDLVRVEMLTTDEAVYKYFFSLANGATGDNNAASPANPVSNLQGDALGYFSAHTFQSKEIKAP